MDSWSLAPRSLKPTANFPYSQQPSKPFPPTLPISSPLVMLQRTLKGPCTLQRLLQGWKTPTP